MGGSSFLGGSLHGSAHGSAHGYGGAFGDRGSLTDPEPPRALGQPPLSGQRSSGATTLAASGEGRAASGGGGGGHDDDCGDGGPSVGLVSGLSAHAHALAAGPLRDSLPNGSRPSRPTGAPPPEPGERTVGDRAGGRSLVR